MTHPLPGPLERPDDGSADSGRLSEREQRVLDLIEGQTTGGDPDFARRMAHHGAPVAVPAALLWRWLAWLVGGLVVLVGAAAVVPASGWAVLGLITTLVVLPWLVLCAAATRRDR